MTGQMIPVGMPAKPYPLLPENMTALERDLSLTMARLETVPIDISVLWDVDRCPVELLPFLAWTVSVDAWSSDWPESLKRDYIRQSLQLHFIKGTRPAIERVLSLLGAGDGDLVEWWQRPEKVGKCRFMLVLPEDHGSINTQVKQQLLLDLVNSVKPLSRWWHVEIEAQATLTAFLRNASLTVVYDVRPPTHEETMFTNNKLLTLLAGGIGQLVVPEADGGWGARVRNLELFVQNHGRRLQPRPDIEIVQHQVPPDTSVETGTLIDANNQMYRKQLVQTVLQILDERLGAEDELAMHPGSAIALQAEFRDLYGGAELGVIYARAAPVLASNVGPRLQFGPLYVKIARYYVPPGIEFLNGVGIDRNVTLAKSARASMLSTIRAESVPEVGTRYVAMKPTAEVIGIIRQTP